MAAGKFKIALIQLTVGKDKNANLHKAESLIREAAENNARVISLPVSAKLFFLLLCPLSFDLDIISIIDFPYYFITICV